MGTAFKHQRPKLRFRIFRICAAMAVSVLITLLCYQHLSSHTTPPQHPHATRTHPATPQQQAQANVFFARLSRRECTGAHPVPDRVCSGPAPSGPQLQQTAQHCAIGGSGVAASVHHDIPAEGHATISSITPSSKQPCSVLQAAVQGQVRLLWVHA